MSDTPINCCLVHRHDVRTCVAYPCAICGEEMDKSRIGGARYFGSDFRWRCGACHELFLRGDAP